MITLPEKETYSRSSMNFPNPGRRSNGGSTSRGLACQQVSNFKAEIPITGIPSNTILLLSCGANRDSSNGFTSEG
jgi:hypothetical protein